MQFYYERRKPYCKEETKLKKLLSLLLALLMLSSMWVTAEETTVYGDVTGDGLANATDALEILKYVVGKVSLNDAQRIAGNVNGDDKVNAEDALQVLQHVVGKRPVFDVALYADVDGLASLKSYKTDVSAFDYEFPVTLTQIGYGYDGKYDVDVPCILGYASGSHSGNGKPYWSLWADKFEYGKEVVRGIMTPINRDSGEYRKKHPERGYMDVQTDYNGNYMDHPTEDYYMVPTESYIEYKWEMLKSHLDTGMVDIIALEEPEFFNRAGYSEGFQEEYEKYYGEEFDPYYDMTPEGMYKNQYFKAYLFYHAFDVLSSRIKENYPGVEVYVASHCTLNYAKHNINSCLGMICSLDTIDGVIAQVWSDSVNMNFYYKGQSPKNPFATALYEYNCYDEMLRDDQKLFLLQDPSSDDGSLPAEDKEALWHDTVVASMMQKDTAAFESPIWPGRAVGSASAEYKTVQSNVQGLFNTMHQNDAQLYTGTPGVAFAMSDSAGWHRWATGNVVGNCISSCTGVTYPLMEDGVTVDTVWLDNLTNVDQLADVNLLILSYDVMKPLSPEVNQVIAQWVKEGGRLLYYGGTNSYDTMEGVWWTDAGTTPVQHLIDQMGLSIDVKYDEVPSAELVRWKDSALDGEMCSFAQAPYCISFEGKGFDTFMTVDKEKVGITASCGKGKITMVGLTGSFYASSQAGYDAVKELATLALEGSATPYRSASAYVAKRGSYYGIHTVASGVELDANKIYLDLFTHNLKVVKGGVLTKNTSYLYYDVTDKLNGEVPELIFSGETLMDNKAFANNQSVFTVAAPSGSTVATAFAMAGKKVLSITAVDADGNECVVNSHVDNDILVVKTTTNQVKAPATVTITWN